MLVIRLSRMGKKKHPLFRVIVSEKTKDTVGDYLELLGNYNPHTNKAELKADRIQYWLSKGAQPSGTVHNLLIDHKIISGEKMKVANIKRKEEEKGKKQPEEATTKPPTKEETKEKPIKGEIEEKKQKAEEPTVDDKKSKKEDQEKISEKPADKTEKQTE